MSKYALAKETITSLVTSASAQGIDAVEAQEALVVSLVQALKEHNGADNVRSLLQYEIDNLGSGNVYDVPRGAGHS